MHSIHIFLYSTKSGESSMVWMALAVVFLVIAVVLFIAIILLTIVALYWARTKKFTPGNVTLEGTVYC